MQDTQREHDPALFFYCRVRTKQGCCPCNQRNTTITHNYYALINQCSNQWCLDVLNDAISRHGKSEIINSDQGSQYTSFAWTNYLEKESIGLSMDGKGRATDNIFIGVSCGEPVAMGRLNSGDMVFQNY